MTYFQAVLVLHVVPSGTHFWSVVVSDNQLHLLFDFRDGCFRIAIYWLNKILFLDLLWMYTHTHTHIHTCFLGMTDKYDKIFTQFHRDESSIYMKLNKCSDFICTQSFKYSSFHLEKKIVTWKWSLFSMLDSMVLFWAEI